ncbi:hypothetical protein [Streptomyces tubercidicus]
MQVRTGWTGPAGFPGFVGGEEPDLRVGQGEADQRGAEVCELEVVSDTPVTEVEAVEDDSDVVVPVRRLLQGRKRVEDRVTASEQTGPLVRIAPRWRVVVR